MGWGNGKGWYNNGNKGTGKGMGQIQFNAGGGGQMGGFVNQTMSAINDIAGLGQLAALGTQIAAVQNGTGSPQNGNAVAGILGATAADGEPQTAQSTKEAAALIKELKEFRSKLKGEPSTPAESGKRSFTEELNNDEEFKKLKNDVKNIQSEVTTVKSAQSLLTERAEKLTSQVTDLGKTVNNGNEEIKTAIMELTKAHAASTNSGVSPSSFVSKIASIFASSKDTNDGRNTAVRTPEATHRGSPPPPTESFAAEAEVGETEDENTMSQLSCISVSKSMDENFRAAGAFSIQPTRATIASTKWTNEHTSFDEWFHGVAPCKSAQQWREKAIKVAAIPEGNEKLEDLRKSLAEADTKLKIMVIILSLIDREFVPIPWDRRA